MELPNLSSTFIYGGVKRHVENITVEDETETFIGMEVRKGGKFSNKIKRYSMNRVDPPIEWWQEKED